MDEKGFLSSEPGSRSTTRLLSIITTIGGLLIFSICAFLAIKADKDIGSNLAWACVSIIGLGIAGKAGGALIERKK